MNTKTVSILVSFFLFTGCDRNIEKLGEYQENFTDSDTFSWETDDCFRRGEEEREKRCVSFSSSLYEQDGHISSEDGPLDYFDCPGECYSEFDTCVVGEYCAESPVFVDMLINGDKCEY